MAQATEGGTVTIPVLTAVITAVITALLSGGVTSAVIRKRAPGHGEGGQVTVEMLESIATKPEMEALERRMDQKLDEIKRTLAEDRGTTKTTSDQTFHRINAISREIAETSGELKQVNANIARLYDMLRVQPNRRTS